MSHQVDSTLDEEPSGGEEEEGNKDETNSTEILSTKVTVTDNGVPKKPEYNKIVATTSPNTICNNKSAYTSGKEFENAYNIKTVLIAQRPQLLRNIPLLLIAVAVAEVVFFVAVVVLQLRARLLPHFYVGVAAATD